MTKKLTEDQLRCFIERLTSLVEETKIDGKRMKYCDLAKITNTSKKTISFWINGKAFPDSKNLLAICEYFNVSEDYLLGKSKYKNSHDWSRFDDDPRYMYMRDEVGFFNFIERDLGEILDFHLDGGTQEDPTSSEYTYFVKTVLDCAADTYNEIKKRRKNQEEKECP